MKKLHILSSIVMMGVVGVAFASEPIAEQAYAKKVQTIQSNLNPDLVKHTQSNTNMGTTNVNGIEVKPTNLKDDMKDWIVPKSANESSPSLTKEEHEQLVKAIHEHYKKDHLKTLSKQHDVGKWFKQNEKNMPVMMFTQNQLANLEKMWAQEFSLMPNHLKSKFGLDLNDKILFQHKNISYFDDKNNVSVYNILKITGLKMTMFTVIQSSKENWIFIYPNQKTMDEERQRLMKFIN